MGETATQSTPSNEPPGPRVSRRKLDLRDFDAVAAEVDRLLAHGYDRAGNWSLAQACDHLSTFMRMSLEGFPLRVPWIISGFLGPLVVKRLTLWTRSIPAGYKTPQPLEPTSAADDAAAVLTFKDVLQRVWAAAQLHPSPLFGRMTPEQWREIHLIHASHHLSFLVPRPAPNEVQQ